MNQTVLSLDVGTTSVKVGLYSAALEPLCCATVEYEIDRHGVCVEAPAGRYWGAVCRGIAQMPDLTQVAALGVTTQGETLLPVDEKGAPLCNALVWLDSRASKQADELSKAFPAQLFYEKTGLPELSGALPLAKLQWFREEMPELYCATHRFLLLEDYLLFRLTGRFVTEKSLLTSTGYFDLQADDYWPEALQTAGVSRDKLPEALECGSPVGILLPACAQALGLPTDVLVCTGAMDQVATALAVGCTRPGTVCETTGTALVLAACTQAPVFSKEHHITLYRHAMRGSYLYLPIGNTAGMALKWFASEFCKDLAQEGLYESLNALCETVPPGCEGLVFLPYLSGSVDPDFLPDATACFFGARLSTTRAHFVRAILESVGYQIADFLEMLRELGCPADTVLSLGGGAKSALWVQMKADICNVSFTVPSCTEAAGMGAALLAAWGAGLLPRDTYPALSVRGAYHPQPETQVAYRNQQARVHQLYQTVKPLYQQEG